MILFQHGALDVTPAGSNQESLGAGHTFFSMNAGQFACSQFCVTLGTLRYVVRLPPSTNSTSGHHFGFREVTTEHFVIVLALQVVDSYARAVL